MIEQPTAPPTVVYVHNTNYASATAQASAVPAALTEAVEKALHALVTAGHIDADNDPYSGVVLYLFPELVGRPGLRDPARHG